MIASRNRLIQQPKTSDHLPFPIPRKGFFSYLQKLSTFWVGENVRTRLTSDTSTLAVQNYRRCAAFTFIDGYQQTTNTMFELQISIGVHSYLSLEYWRIAAVGVHPNDIQP